MSSSLVVIGCQSEQSEPATVAAAADRDVVWAINVGGPAYIGIDGTEYLAEESIAGGDIRQLAILKGSQDATLYKSFREGDMRLAHTLTDGVYDITFHFAEPDEVARGARVFDTLVEGRRVIDDLDVMLFRDGKVVSALTVTAPNIEVADGELNIEFAATAGEPLLSAIVVRNKDRPTRDWKLVWSDEFDGEAVDTEKWSFDVWPARKVNDEDQAYTARETNVRVEDGKLVIEAHKENYEGANYTSGRVHSSGKGDYLYGRFEVRAKLPSGKGTWPAIWMLPSDPYKYATTCEEGEDWQGSQTCNAWPNSGEIDIMEHVGYQMGHVHGSVHNEAYYWVKWEQRKGRILVDGVDADFHVYAMEWTPERIDIFVDDALYFTYINENSDWRVWPYDQPFHLVLNVAVGGWWGRSGGGIDDEIFPQTMKIDYARIYQLQAQQ